MVRSGEVAVGCEVVVAGSGGVEIEEIAAGSG